MKRRTIPIVIAVVLALLAGGIVFFFAQGAERRAMADEQPVDVLVASSVIPKGTALESAMAQNLVETTQVPARLKPAGSLDAVTSENGPLVASADIAAGQVIFASAFVSGLPAAAPITVPDGMMAVSFSLGDPNKVGSFLRPGSKVAIFETITLPVTDAKQASPRVTRLLLDSVEVLAIGATTAEQASGAPPETWQSGLVTLALTQIQAEKLVQASQSGQPYMALLGANTKPTPSAGIGDAELFN